MQYPSFTSFKIAIIICIVTIIWIFSWLLMKTFIKNGQKAFLNPIKADLFGKLMFLFFLSWDNKIIAYHICVAANTKDK